MSTMIKYFVADQPLDDTMKEIKRLVKASMNGVAADSMRQKGLYYKQNFGVSLTRLREIAKQFTPDALLAERLWASPMRECKLLAFMLMPLSEFSDNKAITWLDSITNVELAENGAMLLFSKLKNIVSMAFEELPKSNALGRLLLLLALARNVSQLTPNDCEKAISLSLERLDNDSFADCNAVAILLGQIGVLHPGYALHIESQVAAYAETQNGNLHYLYQQVMIELSGIN